MSATTSVSTLATSKNLSVRTQWEKCFIALAAIYSDLLEEPVSSVQAKHLVHAQLTVLFVLLAGTGGLWLLVVTLLWAAFAVKRCAKAFAE